jgi:hypothetical protein
MSLIYKIYNLAMLIVLSILSPLVAGQTMAEQAKYSDEYISFEYLPNYRLEKKDDEQKREIKLVSGSNQILIMIRKDSDIVSLADAIIENAHKGLKNKGYEVKAGQKTTKKIPLKQGKQSKFKKEAIKYMHVATVTKKNITIQITQNFLYFNHNRQGYLITFTRTNAPYQDLIQILSTFNFNQVEQAITDDDEGEY